MFLGREDTRSVARLIKVRCGGFSEGVLWGLWAIIDEDEKMWDAIRDLLGGVGLEGFGTVAHGEKVGEQSELLDR